MNHYSFHFSKIPARLVSLVIPAMLSYWILDGQFWYLFPPLVGFLSLLVFEYLSSEYAETLKFNFVFNRRNSTIAYIIFYSISIAAIWFLPSANQTLIFLDWSELSLLQWIRTLLMLGLASFLPGYALISLICRSGKSNYPLSSTILFSYLLSALFGGISAISSIVLVSFQNISTNMLVITSENVALLLIFCIYAFQKRRELNCSVTKTYGILESLIIACIVAIIFGAVLVANLQHFPMLSGDQWDHNGIVSLMLNGDIPAYPGKLFSQISYPFFFYLSLFYTFSLTGLPSANSYALLNLFNPILVLAIYYACKSYSSVTRVAITAAVFSLTAGMGWFLFKLSPSYSIASWDIFVYPTYLVYWWATPIGLYALPSILGAIGLIGSRKIEGKSTLLLLTLLLSVGYLMHVLEVAVFIIILCLVLLICDNIAGINGKDLVFVSLGVVALITVVEWLSPVKSYIFTSKFSSISLVILAVVTIPIVSLLLKKVWKIVAPSDLVRHIFILHPKKLAATILLAGIFSGLAWLIALSSKLELIYRDYPAFTTPWYAWPIMLGIPGMLAILSLFSKNPKFVNYRVFFFTFSILAIFAGLGSRFLPVRYSAVGNVLFWELTWIGVCALAGLTMSSRVFSDSTTKRRVAASFLISSILVCGISSTLITIQEYAAAPDLTRAQLEALQFLRDHKNPNSSVLTFTSLSKKLITSFANVLAGKQTIPSAIFPLLQAESPESVLQILNQSDVQFIYIGKEDIDLLNSKPNNSSFIAWLVQNLPIAFTNEQVKIISVPSISFPIRQSSTLLIVPTMSYAISNSIRDAYYRLATSFALSQISFDVRQSFDLNSLFNATNAIMSFNPVIQNESGRNIYSGSDISDWHVDAGAATIGSHESSTSGDKEGVLANFSAITGSEELARVVFNPRSALDLSNYRALSLWIKSSYNAVIDVNIKDISNNWRRWLVPTKNEEWTQLTLGIDEYSSSYGRIQLSKITNIIIGFYNATIPSTLEISQIRAIGNPFTISPLRSMTLASFVNQGGNLIIIAPTRNYFDSLEDTFKFNITKEEETFPEFSNQTFNIETARLGNGTVEYFDSGSLFYLLDHLEQNKRVKLLEYMVSMLNMNESPATAAVPEVPPYWGQTTEISASGQVELLTSFLKPLEDNIQSEVADFTASQILGYYDGNQTLGPLWNNATIYMPDLFNVTSSEVIANECIVRPDGVGQYSEVNFRNGRWIFGVTNGSSIPITIKVEGQKALNITLVGGQVELKITASEFVVAPFSVQVNGVMNLSNAFFAWPPQSIEAAGENLTVIGSSKIWVTSTDGTLLAPAVTVIHGSVVHHGSRSIILSSEVFSFGEIALLIVTFVLISSFFIFLTTRLKVTLKKPERNHCDAYEV